MMSESNKQQAVNKLTQIVANFTAMISTRMPDDVVDKLKQLKDRWPTIIQQNVNKLKYTKLPEPRGNRCLMLTVGTVSIAITV